MKLQTINLPRRMLNGIIVYPPIFYSPHHTSPEWEVPPATDGDIEKAMQALADIAVDPIQIICAHSEEPPKHKYQMVRRRPTEEKELI